MRFSYSAAFERAFRRLSSSQQQQVREAVTAFFNDSRRPSLHFEKLRGFRDVWTIRVSLRGRIFIRKAKDKQGVYWMADHVEPHDEYRRYRR